jgi:multidrug resistance efflux pump
MGGPIEAVEILEKDVFKTNQLYLLEEFQLNEMKRLTPNQHTLALADLKRKEADLALKTAKHALDKHVVKAPCDGHVIEIHIKKGESFPQMPTAMQARPLIVFAPDEPLIARAQIEQSDAWFVKPGMRVTLRDHNPSNPQTWSGTVESLSRWVQRPRSVLAEPDQMNDARIRECIIRIDGKPDNLIIGSMMRVQIDVNSLNR